MQQQDPLGQQQQQQQQQQNYQTTVVQELQLPKVVSYWDAMLQLQYYHPAQMWQSTSRGRALQQQQQQQGAPSPPGYILGGNTAMGFQQRPQATMNGGY